MNGFKALNDDYDGSFCRIHYGGFFIKPSDVQNRVIVVVHDNCLSIKSLERISTMLQRSLNRRSFKGLR
jgi:hypothetical protein